MYQVSSLRSAWRVVLSVLLLLLCVSTPSKAQSSMVTRVYGKGTLANEVFRGYRYISFEPSRNEAFEYLITNPSKTDGCFLSFWLNQNYNKAYPPITLAVTDFTFVKSFFALHYLAGPNTTVNFTRGTADLSTYVYEPFLFKLEPYVGPGFRMYIRDVTAQFNPLLKTRFFGLNIYKQRTFNAATTDQSRSGVYVDNVKVTGARNLLNRNVSYYRRMTYGSNEEHVDTLSVTNSACINCVENFFADSATNVIQNGLVRFLNCTHNSAGAFYAPLGENRGSAILSLSTNGNLVLSNITTKGALFGYTPNSDGVLSSTSRVTLHNITAKSLYPGTTTAQLFSSVPSGAQVYVGPMTLDGVTYTSKDDYARLNLPFTRVIDVNRKVLFVADSEGRAAMEDVSQDNQFSAALCVNDGYSSIGSQLASAVGLTFKAKCNCNADRYQPHCTTTPDVLGESLCPVDMTMSLTQEKCVSCKIARCTRCDTADICEVCEQDYSPTADKRKCEISLDNCKTISNEDKTKCAECFPGFSLTVNGRCVTTIPNCEKYQDDGTCLACTESLTPSGSGLSCVSCNVEHCDKCDDSGDCITCDGGYSWVNGVGCIECNVPGCVLCYETNVCGVCDPGVEGCQVGGEQDTSKGIPWWVWLIVGLGAAVVVGLIIFFIVWCCCYDQKEFFVTYQEKYNEAEEKNGDRDMRMWDRNADVSGYEHGAVFVMSDNVRPRIYKQDENYTHGDGSSFVTSDSSSSASSSSTGSHVSETASDADGSQ